MIQEDLVAERIEIDSYHEMIGYLGGPLAWRQIRHIDLFDNNVGIQH